MIELVSESLQQQPAAADAAAATTTETQTAATAANIRLIFRGQALQPEQQLQHYRIQSGQTIHVVHRPPRPEHSSPPHQEQEQQQQQQQQQQQDGQRQWRPIPLAGGGTLMVAPGPFAAVRPSRV